MLHDRQRFSSEKSVLFSCSNPFQVTFARRAQEMITDHRLRGIIGRAELQARVIIMRLLQGYGRPNEIIDKDLAQNHQFCDGLVMRTRVYGKGDSYTK